MEASAMRGVAGTPGRIEIGGLGFVLMIEPGEIAAAVERVASEIAVSHGTLNPLVVCILNGGALFHADLIRAVRAPLEVDYLRLSSYEGGMRSSGTINFTALPGTRAAGRNVILVEDVVDTGHTVEYLRGYYADCGAVSVSAAAFLYKRTAHRIGRPPEFIGIEIPDRFVIGYGLDYQQQGRNLPGIYLLDDQNNGR